jgi:hypothetical protein
MIEGVFRDKEIEKDVELREIVHEELRLRSKVR